MVAWYRDGEGARSCVFVSFFSGGREAEHVMTHVQASFFDMYRLSHVSRQVIVDGGVHVLAASTSFVIREPAGRSLLRSASREVLSLAEFAMGRESSLLAPRGA